MGEMKAEAEAVDLGSEPREAVSLIQCKALGWTAGTAKSRPMVARAYR